jgi:hypothetical protein
MNRKNYETFFLLYVDNELNREQREEVELFIQQNPDLAIELEMLAAATLETEVPVLFPGKESLYQPDKQEELLLYIDGELDAVAAAALETEIAGSAHLQQQLSLLQQAVLPGELITYEQKEGLYRREERRVVPFNWSRIAIAAALIGIAVSLIAITASLMKISETGTQLFSGKVTEPGSATVHTPAEQLPGQQLLAATPQKELPAAKNGAVVTGAPGQTRTPATADPTIQQFVQQQAPVVARVQQPAAVVNTALSTTQQATRLLPDQQIVPAANDGTLASVTMPATLPAAKATIATPALQVTKPEKHALVTSDIVYKELDTSDEDESIYVGSLELNKNKITGIFKKAGRLLGGKAKNPDNL